MHCLIFIKCSTTDEDYQIRNTQHSKVLNHLGVANQRLYKLHVQDKNQKTKPNQNKKEREKKKKHKETDFSVHHTHQDKIYGTFTLQILQLLI